MWNDSHNSSASLGPASGQSDSLIGRSDIANISLHFVTVDGQHMDTTSLAPSSVTANVSQFDSNMSTMVSPSMRIATEVAHVLEFKLTPIICSLGMVLNVVNMLVLRERGLKESPYIYLRALSFTDFTALFVSMLFLVSSSPPSPSTGFITSDGTTAGDFGVYFGAYVFWPFNNICNNASTWIVVTLTIERFLFVRKPLWARDVCTPSSAKLKTVAVLVVVVLVNVPRFLSYRVVAGPASDGGLLQLRGTPFRYSQAYKPLLWFYSVMFGLVPLLILCMANSYLIYAVKRARRQRRLHMIRNNMEANWNREEARLTMTLISIVCLAIICLLPVAFGDVVVMSQMFSRSDRLWAFIKSPFYKVFRSVSNMLLVCNMSLNFVLYSAFNDKFVRVLKKMIRRWIHQAKGRKRPRGSILIGTGAHRAGLKSASNASKEGSSLTKTTNIDHPIHR